MEDISVKTAGKAAIAGKERSEAAWPPGRYTATYRVTRDGAEMLRKTFEVEVGPR